MCNHASPSVLWLCWNKGFSVLFVSSQAKLNNVRSYEWPRNCLQVIMIPSLSRTNRIRSSSMYMYVYICTLYSTYHPYRVQQPSVLNSRNISYIYLPNTATGCIKNTGCSFNYNHNHKYMYVCINLCTRGILILTLYYYRKESKYVSTEKMGLLCVSCRVML